jgi:hypothetical protein
MRNKDLRAEFNFEMVPLLATPTPAVSSITESAAAAALLLCLAGKNNPPHLKKKGGYFKQ